MSSTGAGYDLSSTTFSPDGRLYQVEYANKAVENSGTTIGLRCTDGLLLAVENVITSKLLVKGSSRRIFPVGDHVGIAVSGLLADGRQVVSRAREESESYLENFGTPIPPAVLADRLAQFVHYFTLHGSVRPFGASILVGGHDEFKGGHELFMIEPSGTVFKYFGTAVGKGRQGAKTEIEKLKLMEKDLATAVNEVTKIFHKLHDESKDKPFEVELAWISEKTGWKIQHVPKEVIAEAEQWARKAIEAEDMDDDDS